MLRDAPLFAWLSQDGQTLLFRAARMTGLCCPKAGRYVRNGSCALALWIALKRW
jgi:hypothetical protein